MAVFDPSQGVMLTRTSVGEVVTGSWRDREREREQQAAAEVHTLREGGGGGRDRDHDRDEQAFEIERQRVIARERGRQRWAKAPSNRGVPSASAAALDDCFTTAIKVSPKRASQAAPPDSNTETNTHTRLVQKCFLVMRFGPLLVGSHWHVSRRL